MVFDAKDRLKSWAACGIATMGQRLDLLADGSDRAPPRPGWAFECSPVPGSGPTRAACGSCAAMAVIRPNTRRGLPEQEPRDEDAVHGQELRPFQPGGLAVSGQLQRDEAREQECDHLEHVEVQGQLVADQQAGEDQDWDDEEGKLPS